MSRVHKIEYREKPILFVDYSHIGPADLDPILAEVRPIIDSSEPKSILLLSDFTGVRYDREATSKIKEFARQNGPYVKASAIVGVTGLKKVIYTGVVRATGRNIHLCDTLDEAKSWLISQ